MSSQCPKDKRECAAIRASHAALLAAAKEAAAWISEGTELNITPSVKGIRTLAKGVKLVDKLHAAIAAAEEHTAP